MITNSLKFRDYFEINFSYDLITNSAICNSRDFIFINSIILTIKELLIYRLIIVLSLNSKYISNVDNVISSFFT